MKKRNRLGLISSILGVFALCGLSALAIFSKPKRTQSVSASMSLTTLKNATCTFNSAFNWNNPNYGNVVPNFMTSMVSYFDNVSTNYSYSGVSASNLFTDYKVNSGKTFYYELSSYIGDDSTIPLQLRYEVAIEVLDDIQEKLYNSSTWGNSYQLIGFYIWDYNYEINYNKPLYFQSFGISTQVYSLLLCPSVTYPYTGNLNFIGGNDVTNEDLLLFLNSCCDYLGLNSFSDDFVTMEQLEQMVSSLTAQLEEQKQENIYLTEQIETAYTNGYDAGVNSQSEWLEQNTTSIYNQGYTDGYNNGSSQDETVATIFSGILQVAFVPVNFFLSIFNFEILGINLSGFIRAIFTVAITIIVIKMITGKGGDS